MENGPFEADKPHLNAALVMGGVFSQFADPLDWLARGFEFDTKVDRAQLMESLAAGGGSGGQAKAAARGSDKTTRFSIEVVGRCENKMVAQCRLTFNHRLFTRKHLEEHAVDLTLPNAQTVLGIQITRGKQ